MLNQNHRFGIEIEFNTRAADCVVVDRLRDQGLTAHGTDRSSNLPGSWGVKYDGSIGRGWEIVSPILSAADMPGQIRSVGRALISLRRDFGYNVTAPRTCGLHVHLSGIGETDTDTMRNFARRWVNFEDLLDLMQPPSRRGNSNSYCRSNLTLFGMWGNSIQQRCDAAWGVLGNCVTRDAIARAMSPDRYYKLNMQSLFRHGTVEVRHHSGTVSGEKMVQWVTFLSAFADVAQNAARVWKRKDGTHPERFVKLMRGVPARTRTYLYGRIVHLNGGHFPGEPLPNPTQPTPAILAA